MYGKANESVIVGAFLIRGQDARSAFDVAPDYESYKFTKLDPSKDKDKEFLADVWDMEKDVTVDGKVGPSLSCPCLARLRSRRVAADAGDNER